MEFKDLEGYKKYLEDLINKNKPFEYINGYIVCLNEHHHLSIKECIELLNYTSNVYFKKMGWK